MRRRDFMRLEPDLSCRASRHLANFFGARRAVDNASTTDQTRFFHKDHLGSIAVITDEGGSVVRRLAHDAWGGRINRL